MYKCPTHLIFLFLFASHSLFIFLGGVLGFCLEGGSTLTQSDNFANCQPTFLPGLAGLLVKLFQAGSPHHAALFIITLSICYLCIDVKSILSALKKIVKLLKGF